MPKIAFIAPDPILLKNSKKIAAQLGLFEHTDFYFAQLTKAVQLARSLENTDVDVLISRYGTSYIMLKSNIHIPIVEINVTGQDLAQAFYEAKKITGLSHPRVTYLAFGNMAHDISRLARILSIDLKMIQLETADDIERAIDHLAVADTDIVMGGARAIAYAASHGFRTQLVQSSEFALREAFLSAKKIMLAREEEKKRTEEFRTIVNTMREGIISINQQRTILIVNPAAEHFLQRTQKELLGKTIDLFLEKNTFDQCLPFIDSCLVNGQKITDKILKVGRLWINLNIIPILVHKKVVGAVLTSQDITQIQEMEIKIRNEVLTKKFIATYQFTDILGISPEIAETKRTAQEFAPVDATVLLMGESGTGKELFAQSIHNASTRKSGPFVAVNCAALPSTLLESELFGYVDGAFTGARHKGKAGLFEMAHHGTIFLDEISEMDAYGQSRLLRVLQERQVMRLGDDKYIPIDVRIIAATNKNLSQLVQEEKFRQDLFYRFKVLTISIPPLRDRNGDIAYLAQNFLRYFASHYNRPRRLEPAALQALSNYRWPGNVRELRCFIERLSIIVPTSLITLSLLQKYWTDRDTTTDIVMDADRLLPPEKETIQQALTHCHSNISQAAQLLGMDRSTLYRKLKHYKIAVKRIYTE